MTSYEECKWPEDSYFDGRVSQLKQREGEQHLI
jgi:hypothetical protein